jgi:hypothetical protein
MQRVSFEKQMISVIEAKDYGSVGVDGDSINMALLRRIAFQFLFGAITGNSILKFYAGATAGAKTTALAFKYRFGGGDFKAASADILGAETDVASTGLTLTAATFDHRQVTVEFEDVDMPNGKPWLTAEIDSTASVMLAACGGIGAPRFAGQTPPTAI